MFEIFNSFFSQVKEMGIEGFTNTFLIGQLILFIFLVGFQIYRINREIGVMKNVKSGLQEIERKPNQPAGEIDNKINELFQNVKKSKYKELWNRYYTRASQKDEDERIKVEPFFGFDVMQYHMGYRPLMDVGGGINVSIGVLGTFIGLSTGLSDLQVNDSEGLRTGIEGLISGMKIAFYTSVWGVLLSLLWTFFDRSISSMLEKYIDWHSERMDYLLSTDDEELFLNRLEKISKTQADHLKTLLTDALEQAMKPVVATIQESNGQVSHAFGALHEQFEKLQTGVDNQSKLLEAQIEMTRQNSADISDRLVEQITGGTEQSIAQFSTLIQDTQTMQSKLMETVSKVVESFVHTEQRQAQTFEKTEQMFQRFHDMTSQMEQLKNNFTEAASFMTNMQQSFEQIQQLTQQQLPLQEEVIKSNQSLAEKYDGLTERMKQFNMQMETKYEQLLQDVLEMSKGLSSSFKEMTERLNQSITTQTQMLGESDKLLQNVKDVVTQLTPIAPEMKEVFGNIKILKQQLIEMQQLQSKLLPELVKLNDSTYETVENALTTTKAYVTEMSTQIETMKQHWTTTKEQFEDTRNTLNTSVKDFAENIDSGLTKTFSHFDEALTNAVSRVSQLVNQFGDAQEDFLQSLEDLTEELTKAKAGSVS